MTQTRHDTRPEAPPDPPEPPRRYAATKATVCPHCGASIDVAVAYTIEAVQPAAPGPKGSRS